MIDTEAATAADGGKPLKHAADGGKPPKHAAEDGKPPKHAADDGDPADRAADRTLAGQLALLIVALGALRLAFADYPLWFDEYATLVFADQPLSRLWSGWMVNETNPPLFYTLTRGWQALGFQTTLALRLLPILFGLAGLALIGIAARLGWGRSAAFTAVLLAGLSPLHIYASQLLRGYMLAADGVLLALIGLLLLLRDAGEPAAGAPNYRALALYTGGSVLAIFGHTTMLLWPPAAMAALVLSAGSQVVAGKGRLLRHLIVANLLVLALSGWWLGITLAQLRLGAENVSWIRSYDTMGYVDLVARSVLLVNQPYLIERFLVIGFGVTLVAAVWADRRTYATRFTALVLLFGAGLFWAASIVHPIATAMILFWLLPLVALLIAGGLGRLRDVERARQGRLVLFTVLAANLLMHGTQLNEQDFRGAIRTVAARPGAALVVEGATMGAVTARACAHDLNRATCPIRILTVSPPQAERTWASALGTVNTLSPAQLATALRCCRSVYTLRTLELDPLLDFGIRSPDSRISWSEPFLEGPIAPSRFDPAAFRAADRPGQPSQP